MPELKIKLTAGTNVGLVRGNNEDNFVVCRNLIKDDWTIPQAGDVTDLGPYGALLVVADGMGGANAGEVASNMAIETVQQTFGSKRLSDVIKSDEDILNFLCSIMHNADKLISKHSKKHKDTRGMGTTLVIAWLLNGKAYVCWCGDSRCYVFNPEVGLTRLTKDHSLVQMLIDKGELTSEDAHNHPMSNVITQCLGAATSSINPGTRIYQFVHNDVLLLCTDGLCGLCSDDEIMKVMADCEDVVAMKSRLIEEALNAGGHDNVTVAICHVDAPSLSKSDAALADMNATLRSDIQQPEATETSPTNKPEDKDIEALSASTVKIGSGTDYRKTMDKGPTKSSDLKEKKFPKSSKSHSGKRFVRRLILILLLLLTVTGIAYFASHYSGIHQSYDGNLSLFADSILQELKSLLQE